MWRRRPPDQDESAARRSSARRRRPRRKQSGYRTAPLRWCRLSGVPAGRTAGGRAVRSRGRLVGVSHRNPPPRASRQGHVGAASPTSLFLAHRRAGRMGRGGTYRGRQGQVALGAAVLRSGQRRAGLLQRSVNERRLVGRADGAGARSVDPAGGRAG